MNTISSIGEVTPAELTLAFNAKQNLLIAGTNITIDELTNTISSIGEVTQAELTLALDAKQPNILSTDNLTCNSITVSQTAPTENNEPTSKIYVDNGLAEKEPNILSTDNLTCNSITVLKTAPTENDELTSKMYVDNGLTEKVPERGLHWSLPRGRLRPFLRFQLLMNDEANRKG
jgi:hypothetical protein